MSTNILDVLPGQEIVHSSPLGTVTQSCIVLAASDGQPLTILSLANVSSVEKINVTYPALLVGAIGALIIAAAALCSKEGDGAGAPVAVLGLLLAIGYVVTRKGAVLLVIGSEEFETTLGRPNEATRLITAIRKAQRGELVG